MDNGTSLGFEAFLSVNRSISYQLAYGGLAKQTVKIVKQGLKKFCQNFFSLTK